MVVFPKSPPLTLNNCLQQQQGNNKEEVAGKYARNYLRGVMKLCQNYS